MSLWLVVVLTAMSTLLWKEIYDFVRRQVAERENKARQPIEHLYAPGDGQFQRTMAGLFTAPSKAGNGVVALRNGDEIFPAMLEAVRGAERTITFETFIYWAGDIGREFADALSERARNGVAVHVLLDWFGSSDIHRDLLSLMREGGVELERYHRPRFTRFHHANHRTHRKLLVVDGAIGFTGGVGIADEWTGNAEDPNHWRDSHFRIEGPGVAGLQRAFMDNWIKARGVALHSDRYFPPLEKAGNAICQLFQSSPQGGSDSVRLMFLLAIAAAEKSVRISTAYFVPDSLAMQTLSEARARGVRVEIIVPGEHNDSALVRSVSRARYGALLREGIEIYEYAPTMYHTKLMIIDETWISVGSTNFDNRSFRLNDEANLNVYDPDLAMQQTEWFEEDKARSQRINLESWSRRPLTTKAKEHAAAIFRTQV